VTDIQIYKIGLFFENYISLIYWVIFSLYNFHYDNKKVSHFLYPFASLPVILTYFPGLLKSLNPLTTKITKVLH